MLTDNDIDLDIEFREFLNGPIYWSAAGGAHPVVNSFLNRWGLNNYEAGRLKYPTTDEIVLPDGGRRQEFQQGVIYVAFQNAVGSAMLNGPLRDKYNTVGGLAPGGTLLGYPIQDQIAPLPDGQGQMGRFQNGVIYWHPTHGAHSVVGQILAQWSAQGYESGSAGYPLEDQRQISATGFEQQFQNTTHAWPRRASDDFCGAVCTEDPYTQFPQFAGIVDLISQAGAPGCGSIPPAAPGADEQFYECFDPTGPALRMPGEDSERDGSARGSVQPSGSILNSNCYDEPSGKWKVERFYSCVHLDDLNGHGVVGDKGQNGGRMNYVDLEISIERRDSHGRQVDVKFRAIPKLSGIAANTILEIYPACSYPGGECEFNEPKGYEPVYTDEPVEFSWWAEFDAPDPDQVTAPLITFDMKHVPTGGTPVDTYKPAPLPYEIGEAPTMRCDSFARMRGTSDCIFPGAFPLMALSPQYNLPEAEWHITQAQQSGLPGASEEFPLHRATPAESSASASIACKTTSAYPPRPKNKQCDEYPLKATKEGAQLSGPGTERTFHPECSMKINNSPVFQETTGPTGFSVCMINASQNQAAGSALTWLYQKYRIKEGEAFALIAAAGSAPTEGDLVLNN